MYIPDYGTFHQHLCLVAADKALLHQFKFQHPELIQIFRDISGTDEPAPSLTALPASTEITAFQATVFDNWRFNKRGQRWGMNFKAWTTAKIVFGRTAPSWSANATMWEREEALKKAKALQSPKLKNPISDQTVGLIEQLLDHQSTGLFGLLKHMKASEGTFFYEAHAVWLGTEGDVPASCFLFTPQTAGWLPAFSPKDAHGNALRDKAVAQARHSSREGFSGWITGEADL